MPPLKSWPIELITLLLQHPRTPTPLRLELHQALEERQLGTKLKQVGVVERPEPFIRRHSRPLPPEPRISGRRWP
jgi:hypothetical protein